MRVSILFLYLVLFFFSSQKNYSQYITVNENYTAQQLVEDILINSSCATISNVVVSGGNFGSGEKSWGYFNKNNSTFPFENGIILSSGKINNAPGPNIYLSDDGGNMGWDGDADLNQALGLNNSFNATVLEFDFIPLGTKISFDYMLSSEQYLSNPAPNQCNFTDGFAFLLKESSSTNQYQNLAVIPGTSTPVKINTVRGPGTICPQANPQYFDAFNGNEHPTNYNGQTKILTAQATVTPGVQYHIKLVIADEGNYRYDSAIFLGGGSFNFGIDIGEDRLIANGNPVCENESLTLNANTSGATAYQWKLNGNNLVNETNPILSLNPPYNIALQQGIYSVAITFGSNCTTTASVNIEFAPNLITNLNSFFACDETGNQDGITVFNLNNIATQLFTNLPNNYQITFFESPTSLIPLPNLFENTIAFQQVIYAKITNIQGCYSSYQVTLNVSVFDNNIQDETIGLCEGSSIQLNAGTGFSSYSWNTIPSQNTQTIMVSNPGNYTVTLGNNSNCFITKTFTIVTSEIATITNININDFSTNNTVKIITSGNGNYEFSLDGITYQDSNLFTHLETGEYIVYVNDKNGCGISTKSFYILDYPKFFTPNNDGYNDYWKIENLDKRGFENSKIYIFDRYGKLLKQINPTIGWDGIFNTTPLPSEDYWFIIELPNGKTIKSHFSLIR